MKIVFFGLGSIGCRHANILLKKYSHKIYASRSGVNPQTNELGLKELHSWSEVNDLKPDVAFITNPTSQHIETAIKCAKINCKLFIEKPLDKNLNQLDELLTIVKAKKLVSYLAYNLRFHPVILYLKKYIDKQQPLHVRVVCTSYLPFWRQDTNFRKSYSANAKMGGGVILDLSHELDYVSYLFKGIDTIDGNYGKRGNVTVDCEDYVDYLIKTKLTPVNIHINFMSNLHQRYVQIDFEKITIVGDILNLEIKEYQKETLTKTFKLDYHKDQEYISQIKFFFDNINNPNMMNNLIEASDLYKKIIDFKNENE